MLKGCEHCGVVVRRQPADAVVDCAECGRPLRTVDDYEARILARERRIAEQFRRANRLRRVPTVRQEPDPACLRDDSPPTGSEDPSLRRNQVDHHHRSSGPHPGDTL